MKRLLRQIFYAVAPGAVRAAYLRWRLPQRARRLRAEAERAGDPGAWCRLLWQFPEFLPLQRVPEITRLLEQVGRQPPQTIVEIGSAAGGTAFLFSRVARPDASLVLVDMAFDAARRAALESLGRADQRVRCLAGDSHSEDMVQRVREALEGRAIDLLFIDGDHRYEGVSADFRLYSPLVSTGGIIAFHDIVPVRSANTVAGADAGGVPTFWREIGQRFAAEEIVESPTQDGCGIGLIRWHGPAVHGASPVAHPDTQPGSDRQPGAR